MVLFEGFFGPKINCLCPFLRLNNCPREGKAYAEVIDNLRLYVD